MASKIALSDAVGTEAPEAPPDVSLHLVVEFQLPVPPTQYLSAMLSLYRLEDSLAVDLDLLIGYAVDLHGVGLHRWRRDSSDPVVAALLFHSLDLSVTEPVVV